MKKDSCHSWQKIQDRGLNFGKVISSVNFSNTASTGISHRTSFGSHPTMFVIICTPSSSRTMAITNGRSAMKADGALFCTTEKVYTVPRPEHCTQLNRSEEQNGHAERG